MIPTDGVVLADFYADWCAPCASIKSALEEIESEVNLKVLRFNVEEEMDLAIEHGVQSIPTLIMFEDGKETRRLVGAASKSAMMSELGIK
jgi:thioredoxin 1